MANGFKQNGMFYRWWSARNRRIFSGAHRIFTLSENMKSRVLAYTADADVRVISNWSAFSGCSPVKKEQNSIIKKEGLDGKFIVQYSGNIGVTHNVETLVEVAELLKDHPDIEFLIIGRGERSREIGDMILRKGLTNCRLLPFRKDEELFESLCAADLAVITLDDKTTDISVPSKLYNIMAAGLPVMAIAPLNSAIADIIGQFRIGRAFGKNNISGMGAFILELINNPDLREKLASNSLKASENFTTANAAKYIEYYNE
jgi:glycosyltransferase involved in cell wall biosynthesis